MADIELIQPLLGLSPYILIEPSLNIHFSKQPTHNPNAST